MPEQPLSLRRQLGYACGMLGWSIMINIIAVMLIYFYIPPSNSGMGQLIPQATFLGIFTLLSLIAASGRLLDAVTDPLIANWSDRFHHPKGRRIPFMKMAILPSVFFGILIFIPLEYQESYRNVWWLAAIQAGFYLSLTVYIIPYNALLPELAPGSAAKVRLSTWLSLAFVMGIILSSQTPALADLVQGAFKLSNRHAAFQLAIGSLYLLGGAFMLVPLFCINEQRDCYGQPATVPLGAAFRHILANRNFLVFIVADFSYFVSLTIISSGMLYFVKVLLFLNEGIGGVVMGVMVLFSLLFYPLVVRLAIRVEKRKLIIWSLLSLGVVMMGLFFLGKMPLPPRVQIFGFALIVAIPTAFLGILPYALIAEIAEQDGNRTGEQKEAMFFAVRNFSTKLGQTVGIMAFTILTLLGKDPFDDLGIRLSAVFGGILCILAGLIFTRFEEPEGA
ncbi:MAG: MFS transporter [Lewinellaceae bacterium]|nr:MFS transporter [Lewinellaceae bacterium]